MKAELSADAFAGLLSYFDGDRDRAGEKYEDLRTTLTRFFQWRGAPLPEEQTDEVLDRLARKISAGVEVKNIRAYAYEIARLVLLETHKRDESRRTSLDEARFKVATESFAEIQAKELRLRCLDDCLSTLGTDQRELIMEYYRDQKRERINHRQQMAVQLGLTREALANRAQRLRDKLEKCVVQCAARNERYEH